MPTVLTNAELILEDETCRGTVVFDETGILALDRGGTQLAGAIDCGGDYVAPGLIEMHTDNMEKHFMPRPKVFWDPIAAVVSYDGQLATSGITTVLDSLRVWREEGAEEIASASMPALPSTSSAPSSRQTRSESSTVVMPEVANCPS